MSSIVGKINFVTIQNQSNECESFPSYLKLIPYPKFKKIFLLSSSITLTIVHKYAE